jgi:hypothetical protein
MRTTNATLWITPLLVGVFLGQSACGKDKMSPDQIVKVLRAEIVIGMKRSEVEKRLAGLPVKYVYVPRSGLETTRETKFQGRELSGRFDVLTPHERDLTTVKHAATIFIELDQQERVANVRIETFGF